MTLRTVLIAAVAIAPSLAAAEAEIVENPSQPAQGDAVVEATEEWRVGGYDERFLFGIVASAAIDAAGNTYLLDEQLSEVTVIDPQGDEINKFGREGEGPGELQQAQRVMSLPGDRIGILNMRPPRVNTYDLDGNPLGDFSLSGNEGMHFALDAEAAGERLVVQTTSTSFGDEKQTTENVVRAIDPTSGDPVRDYLSNSEERDRLGDGGRMVITIGGGDFLDEWALADDGTLYVLRDRKTYEIEVYDPSGTHVRTIRRDFERKKRPQQDIEDDIAERKAMAERVGMEFDEDDVETMEPAVAGLVARPDGTLWVRPGGAIDDPDVVAVFDEFDAAGSYARRVELRAPYDREQDRFKLIGDHLVVFEDLVGARGSGFIVMGSSIAQQDESEEEFDPLTIVRYKF